jgi:pyridoxamine 5'-phosphate oxidase family protein
MNLGSGFRLSWAVHPDATAAVFTSWRATMSFTQIEVGYLTTQILGRLATVQPDGTLQVSPVGFHYNTDLAVIDISGYNMAASRKYRNVVDNGRVAFVVDDIASVQPWRVRCLEIRGLGEAIDSPLDSATGSTEAIIRIHPRRIISFGIDNSDLDPHLLIPTKRNVT